MFKKQKKKSEEVWEEILQKSLNLVRYKSMQTFVFFEIEDSIVVQVVNVATARFKNDSPETISKIKNYFIQNKNVTLLDTGLNTFGDVFIIMDDYNPKTIINSCLIKRYHIKPSYFAVRFD